MPAESTAQPEDDPLWWERMARAFKQMAPTYGGRPTGAWCEIRADQCQTQAAQMGGAA